MSHPILIASLAEERRRWCPCGAVAQQPCGLCRECRAAVAWRRKVVLTSHRTSPATRRAQLFSWMTLLLQIISKGAES